MQSIDEILNNASSVLTQKLRELRQLEKEKVDIMQRFSQATEQEQLLIQQEMNHSIEKYKALANEVAVLSDKIQHLKDQYSY